MGAQRIALVTGASRGIGRGVATGLAASGFRVFATGRSVATADLPADVVRVPCDHRIDQQTASVFHQIEQSSGRLDLLVNSAWGGYETMFENGVFTWNQPFWHNPALRWTGMIDAGVRAALLCASHAARLMTAARSGLIVNVSYWAARKYMGNVIYGISKAATDKLTADMAHELRPHNVAAVSLYPGLVRTEAVLQAAGQGWIDLANSESPDFIGLVIAALFNDPALMDRSGRVWVAAELAAGYGLTDIDGRRPKPLTLDTA